MDKVDIETDSINKQTTLLPPLLCGISRIQKLLGPIVSWSQIFLDARQNRTSIKRLLLSQTSL